MIRAVLVLIVLLAHASGSLAAQFQSTYPSQTSSYSGYTRPLLSDEAANVTMQLIHELPSLHPAFMKSAIQFTHIAKGYYVDKKCHFLDDSSRSHFMKDYEHAKKMLEENAVKEFGGTIAQARNTAYRFDQSSAIEMDARRYFDCGSDARTLLDYSLKELQNWVF